MRAHCPTVRHLEPFRANAIIAEAAHWFDWTKFWPEAARVLRPGGTVAFWVHCFVSSGPVATDARISSVQVYSDFRLSRFPSLTPLINDYAEGKDPATSLGPHWQYPGHTVLEDHLVDVPKATDVMPDSYTDWQHTFFTGMLIYFRIW